MILLIILIPATIIFLVIYVVPWLTHRDMVRGDCTHYGKATFSDFLREFNKVKWERKDQWPISYFSDNHSENYIHASIIKFKGKGMILSLWGWIKFDSFVNNNKLKTKRSDYNWKENV